MALAGEFIYFQNDYKINFLGAGFFYVKVALLDLKRSEMQTKIIRLTHFEKSVGRAVSKIQRSTADQKKSFSTLLNPHIPLSGVYGFASSNCSNRGSKNSVFYKVKRSPTPLGSL